MDSDLAMLEASAWQVMFETRLGTCNGRLPLSRKRLGKTPQAKWRAWLLSAQFRSSATSSAPPPAVLSPITRFDMPMQKYCWRTKIYLPFTSIKLTVKTRPGFLPQDFTLLYAIPQ
jgi:hypothetical protein